MNLLIRKLILFPVLFLCTHQIFSRQVNLPKLTISAIKNWPTIGLAFDRSVISNDGKYVGYFVDYLNSGSYKSPTLYFQDLNGKWKYKVENMIASPVITEDSKYGIALSGTGELTILELGSRGKKIFYNIALFKVLRWSQQEYLVIKQTTPSSSLKIINLKNWQEEENNNIFEFAISASSPIYSYVTKVDSIYQVKIKRINSKDDLTIWSGGRKVSNLIISNDGKRICFYSDSNIWIWDINLHSYAKKLIIPDNRSFQGMTMVKPEYFSQSGNLLFFRIQSSILPSIFNDERNIKSVRVFSYQDYSFNGFEKEGTRQYLCVFNLNTGNTIRLEQEYDHVSSISSDENTVAISHIEGSSVENYWNDKALNKGYVISLSDTSRIYLNPKTKSFTMAYSGNYVVSQNDTKGDLLCLNIKTGRVVNITEKLPIPSIENKEETPSNKNSRGIEYYNWSHHSDTLIFYDRYDIWMADPQGITPPVNLTNGFGRKNHIMFRFFQQRTNEKPEICYNNELIITGFNEKNKDNGFFKIKVGNLKDPKKLTMGPYVYNAPGQRFDCCTPLRSRNKNIWLLSRMSSNESPNYFWTSDFEKFHLVSDIYPEKSYQWFKTELITFYTKDSIKTQAILYKPNNFDSTKRYPVLFNYYEHESDKLNTYCPPTITNGFCFNFPLMLSNDYIICLTDIHFKLGAPSQSIVNAVEGAGDYLAQFPYIDNQRYGICGGSFGGYATNCLVAFSKKFAAAVSISGVSDLFSLYGNVPGLRDEEVENRQFRMNASLASAPEKYLQNSPIAYAQEVKTPILIVNTLKDYNVNVQQGIEWFITLRREGKLAWMLGYPHEGHGIGDYDDQLDLYNRMNQFFDHYLKGAPAPIWMTTSMISNKNDSISGFEIDKNIKTPLKSRLISY